MNWTPHLSADAPPFDPADGPLTLPRLDMLTLTELVLPEQSNHYGTLFGPNGLALLGKAAYLVATRYTRQKVVMAGANRIAFRQPVPVGVILKITACVTRLGRTSLTAHVQACFDAAPGTRPATVLSGEFEMVTVDDTGRATPVMAPPLASETVTDWAIAAARG